MTVIKRNVNILLHRMNAPGMTGRAKTLPRISVKRVMAQRRYSVINVMKTENLLVICAMAKDVLLVICAMAASKFFAAGVTVAVTTLTLAEFAEAPENVGIVAVAVQK